MSSRANVTLTKKLLSHAKKSAAHSASSTSRQSSSSSFSSSSPASPSHSCPRSINILCSYSNCLSSNLTCNETSHFSKTGLGRRLYSTSNSSSSSSSFPSLTLAKVPHRSIIEFKGRDTLKLLQGLISNDVKVFESGIKDGEKELKAIYAVFLHPNGRMVADAYIYSHPSSIRSNSTTPGAHLLLECDSRILPSLSTFIKKFKLRSKVSIKDVTQDWQVWQSWKTDASNSSSESERNEIETEDFKRDLELKGVDEKVGVGMIVVKDVRSPGMGKRIIIPSETELSSKTHSIKSSEFYTAHRIIQGVPEGSSDFIEGSSLPLEMNCDYMNGVDFRKGCYVGQELTARTHHTGVVRKRVVPISFYKEGEDSPTSPSFSPDFNHQLPSSGTEIRSFPISSPTSSTSTSTSSSTSISTSSTTPKKSSRGKAAGKFSSGIGNLGLACLRLEQVKRWSDGTSNLNQEEGKGDLGMSIQTDEGTLFVKPFLPDWWPKEIEEDGVREERGDQYGEGVSE